MTRVVLTQPRPRADRLAAKLAARGHEVAMLSFRRLVGLADSEQVRATFARLRDFQWVVFVSPGAIESAVPVLPERWPPEVGIAVIGPGSLQALRDAGIDIDRVRCIAPTAPPYDADALMRLEAFAAPRGARFLIAAGDRGRADWIDALAERGARVERLCLYRNEPCNPDADALEVVRRWASRSQQAAFVFTSLDAVSALARLSTDRGWHGWAAAQPAFAPHARIAAALGAAGWLDARAIEPGEQALCAALESHS